MGVGTVVSASVSAGWVFASSVLFLLRPYSNQNFLGRGSLGIFIGFVNSPLVWCIYGWFRMRRCRIWSFRFLIGWLVLSVARFDFISGFLSGVCTIGSSNATSATRERFDLLFGWDRGYVAGKGLRLILHLVNRDSLEPTLSVVDLSWTVSWGKGFITGGVPFVRYRKRFQVHLNEFYWVVRQWKSGFTGLRRVMVGLED